MKPNKPKSTLRRLLPPIILVVVACLIYFSVDFFDLSDRFYALGYDPSPALAAIEADVPLTDKGKLVLAASRPELDDRDDFNTNCRSNNVEISILGCYTNDVIYIYHVDNSELSGIEQSTLAHELLHAVWARLSDGEKNDLTSAIDIVYSENKSTLDSELAHYEDSMIYEELHSRIGTEFRSLPKTLEDHYAKYFTNRSKVVDFFDAYNDKFQNLKTAATHLLERIEALEADIDARVSSYYSAIEELNADISDFNNRASSGYFSSTAAFNAERAGLVAESERLSGEYATISSLVDECNALIIEYNENLARAENLNSAINSNLTPAPTL